MITPNVYSYTELTVGMEGRKMLMFVIITIAAKVIDRPVRFHKWGVVKGGTCREGRTRLVTQGIDQRDIPRHARHTQFKAGVSQGSHSLCARPASEEDLARCPACDHDPDSNLCIPESSCCLLMSPVQDFLVLPGSCWWDANACSTQLWETQYHFYIFYFSYY